MAPTSWVPSACTCCTGERESKQVAANESNTYSHPSEGEAGTHHNRNYVEQCFATKFKSKCIVNSASGQTDPIEGERGSVACTDYALSENICSADRQHTHQTRTKLLVSISVSVRADRIGSGRWQTLAWRIRRPDGTAATPDQASLDSQSAQGRGLSVSSAHA